MEHENEFAPPLALTIGDAAKRLSVSAMTIRRLLASGQLLKVVIGRSIRVSARSVEALVERGGVARAK
jgi:excisionase family DNA binding protein